MAARTVLRIPLDANNLRVERVGPTVQTDAAHASTVLPQPVGPANVPGTSPLASADDHEHEGVHQIIAGVGVTIAPLSGLGDVTINATGGGSPGSILSLDADEEYVTSLGSEELLAEFSLDFGAVPGLITCDFVALTRQTPVGPGTYMVRVGGTVGVANGTIFATLVTNQLAYPSTPDGVTGPPIANPLGKQLVKITAASAAINDEALIRAFDISFK